MGSTTRERLDKIQAAVDRVAAVGLVQQAIQNAHLGGREIDLRAGQAVHFGSCSYLGLETDARLKQAACDAVERYGVIFSSSRSYVRLPLYDELEGLLREMVGGWPVVVAPSTSLAHQSALPILIGDRDAVCFDVLVHSSVQAVLPALAQRGIRCEVVPHNRIDVLERYAKELLERHERVFYLCDGVYSMRGDLAPLPELLDLLDRVPALHAYVDDAHGVGWAGRHGAGVVLGEHGLHPQMTVALSLSKGFGAGGGLLVLREPASAQRILACGGTLMFSGQLPPASLGAGIASARVHLSDELSQRQAALRTRIDLFDRLAAGVGISCTSASRSPIRFIEIGSLERTTEVARSLLAQGYYVNLAAYPAVSRGRAGIRLMLTCHHTLDDVIGLVQAIERAFRLEVAQTASA
ncbi:MAG TPA: aminotransferase class I/II-fold pyridoxal phosphate-dependent enzyme [Polyangiaceae bacterium]|nr:aminotransferase class I/II-fold pyridoxal phosphate-dependent enzyme [Polyangiaceae bacterium]